MPTLVLYSMRISAEQMLVKCPRCGAWPMALVGKEHHRLAFKCPTCRAVNFYTVGADGSLIPVPRQSAEAGRGLSEANSQKKPGIVGLAIIRDSWIRFPCIGVGCGDGPKRTSGLARLAKGLSGPVVPGALAVTGCQPAGDIVIGCRGFVSRSAAGMTKGKLNPSAFSTGGFLLCSEVAHRNCAIVGFLPSERDYLRRGELQCA